MQYKVCYKCRKKLELNSDNFAISKKSSDGFDGRCKHCVNLLSKKYRENKGEKYRLENISKSKEQQNTRLSKGMCRHDNTLRLENSDTLCEKHWFEYVAKHHLGTMKKGKLLKDLFDKQNGKCVYTGLQLTPALNASIDHILPLSKNPEMFNDIENLQWVHSDINLMKRNHLEDDFLNYIKLIYENRFWVGTIQYTGGDLSQTSFEKHRSVKPEAHLSLANG